MQCFGCGGAEDFKLKGFNIAARSVAVLSDTVLVFVARGVLPPILDRGVPRRFVNPNPI